MATNFPGITGNNDQTENANSNETTTSNPSQKPGESGPKLPTQMRSDSDAFAGLRPERSRSKEPGSSGVLRRCRGRQLG